jgi:hypothetical protein
MPASNTLCAICGRMRPASTSKPAGLGRAGLVPAKVCARCFNDPDAGIRERREAQRKVTARRGAGPGARGEE